ncbi:DUF4854 domain-containing protein [bacterium D16-76]|nr:DUF4854 domain-containing protein [bacterium D16-76]
MKKRAIKRALGLFLSAMLVWAGAVPALAAMEDIDGHWAQAAITFCLENNYMQGLDSTTFQPQGPVVRAQVVQVLYNMSGRPDVSALPDPFEDAQNHWAADAIKWAKSTGVVQGVSDTAFAPGDQVTRAQVTTMFQRYAAQDPSNTHNDFDLDLSVLDRYPDKGQIAPWYQEGVAWAVQYGFMQGSGGRLDPAGNLTRAQMAQFIQNYFQPIQAPDPAPSDKYPTVEALLQDPEIQAALEEALAQMGADGTLDIRLWGDADTLYYDFSFPQGAITDANVAAVRTQLQKQMQAENFAQVFRGIAQVLGEVTEAQQPRVSVSYYTYEGALIASQTYQAS